MESIEENQYPEILGSVAPTMNIMNGAAESQEHRLVQAARAYAAAESALGLCEAEFARAQEALVESQDRMARTRAILADGAAPPVVAVRGNRLGRPKGSMGKAAPVSASIAKALSSYPQTPRQVATAAKMKSLTSVYQLLKDLVGKGLAVKTTDGKYKAA